MLKLRDSDDFMSNSKISLAFSSTGAVVIVYFISSTTLQIVNSIPAAF